MEGEYKRGWGEVLELRGEVGEWKGRSRGVEGER